MAASDGFCCEGFRDAALAEFAVPIDSPTGWILYGTDHPSVAAGAPELRYWAIRCCPFCGAVLPPPPSELLRRR